VPSSTSSEDGGDARKRSAQRAEGERSTSKPAEAERSPGVDVAPFDLPGRGAAAALCLHGLTGTPWEVRPLGLALSARGVRALGPALPGHNETPERLAQVGFRDWLGAARASLAGALEAYGIAPDLARERVAALTDAEALALAERVADAPAGGVAGEVIGIIFVVLFLIWRFTLSDQAKAEQGKK